MADITTLVSLSPADRHRAASAGFANIIAAVTNWEAQSPVPDWRARDVVAHLTEWFPAFLADGGIDLGAAPSAATDPVGAWAARSRQVQELLDGPEPDREFTHSRAGTHPLSGAVDMFYTSDVFMHTWDLAQAAGVEPELDPQFADQLLAGMEPIDEMLRASGQYGPAVPVPADADPVSRLMGFVGRDQNWR